MSRGRADPPRPCGGGGGGVGGGGGRLQPPRGSGTRSGGVVRGKGVQAADRWRDRARPLLSRADCGAAVVAAAAAWRRLRWATDGVSRRSIVSMRGAAGGEGPHFGRGVPS